MNLYRFLSRSLLSSASSPARRLLLRPAAALSTAAPQLKRRPRGSASVPEKDSLRLTPPKKPLPRPSEIPYQPRVANLVHLVGTVGVPVQLQAASDGVYSAVSVLVQKNTGDFPHFWIPVIFKGDLAEIAACHLNESDLVCVTGQLCGDAPSLKLKDAQTGIQVLAQSLNFVEKGSHREEESIVHEEDVAVSNFSVEVEGAPSIQQLWDDLLANPHSWWDSRSDKKHPTSADFKHKDSGQSLWVNESTPEGVRSKLHLLFCQETSSKSLWSELVTNMKQWRDCRMDKKKGLVNPKYPDFKHKDTQKGLWVGSAPEWVLSKLDGLEFNGGSDVTKQVEVEGAAYIQQLWDDLLANPHKWDNRSDKKHPTSADFKHKDSGQSLWLNESTPEGVRSRLDLLFCQETSSKSLWIDLVTNTKQWRDCRMDKKKGLVNPKYPDFKHKDTQKGLWVGRAPEWVLSKLDGLEFNGGSDVTKQDAKYGTNS